jgi:hypothetical protein
MKCVHRDGLPTYLLKKSIHIINQELNNILLDVNFTLFFDNELNLLWKNKCVTGHYPFAYDMDEDGKDELMMGYTLFDDDGEKLWTLDNTDGYETIKCFSSFL